MAKPVILAVDDDPPVLRAVERDLRRQYGRDYRVLAADSGATALETLRQVALRSEPVALLVVDQRMPGMTGVDLLAEAIKLFPDVKRVLLTAYADTEVAIRAINAIRLDQYLMKPWDPPEEKLYPVLADLLDDWLAAFRPPFEGIRVVGHRWSARAHEIREFLARNQVPYRWLDVEADEEGRRLVESMGGEGAPGTRLPMVVLADGTALPEPTNVEVAERVGLRTRAQQPFYDLVIVGGGPAGLAAAVYGASEGLKTLLLEREAPGGQAGQSSRIENYLGFPVGLSGADLARRAVAQASRLGAELLTPQEVSGLRIADQARFVALTDGSELGCRALLVATGVQYRKLEAPGIERLAGVGVYYGAALSEVFAYRDRDVYIVGSGNSAGQSALYLERFARSVTMLVRGDGLVETMSAYLIDEIEKSEKIRVRFRTSVAEAHGENELEALTLSDAGAGATETLPAAALFIFIGATPRTDWLGELVERDPTGYILTGSDLLAGGRRPRGWTLDRDPYLLEASVPGIFVAGDVRHESIKRIASAVGEGAMAVRFVHQYLTSV